MKRIKKVQKGEFRFKLHSNDLESFDKRIPFEKESGIEDDYNIVGLIQPIYLYETYDPLIKYFEDQIEKGDCISYVNPKKYNRVTKQFIVLLNGFLRINEGIDGIGIKKLAQFIKYNYVNSNNITLEEIKELLSECSKIDSELYISQNSPLKLKPKYVFFPKDVNLNKYQKIWITQSFIKKLKNAEIRRKLDLVIDELENMDCCTKITNTRISQKSQIQIKKIERVLTRKQKKRLEEINMIRQFKSEKVTTKFIKFAQNLEKYMNMGIQKTMTDLSISKPSYYVFKNLAYN